MAIKADLHLHSSFSGDSKASMESMIEKAIAEGEPYDLLITDMHFSVNGVDDTKAGFYVID